MTVHRFTIDFDTNDWMPRLREALAPLLPPDVDHRLQSLAPRYVEDARGALAEMSGDVNAMIDAVLEWVRGCDVRLYHGTRLTDIEVEGVRVQGLRPLNFEERIDRLFAELPDVNGALSRPQALELARSGRIGGREGQLHTSISRGIMADFDYAFLGSEFDRRILEASGLAHLVPMLSRRGMPRVVVLEAPGDIVLPAMHPYFPIDDVRIIDVYPNFVRDLLEQFAWQVGNPNRRRQYVDVCPMFREALAADFVKDVETWPEKE